MYRRYVLKICNVNPGVIVKIDKDTRGGGGSSSTWGRHLKLLQG